MSTPLSLLLRSDNPDLPGHIRLQLAESFILYQLDALQDDAELLAYLRREEKYEDPRSAPRPNLLLIDLDSLEESAIALLKALHTVPSLDSRTIVLMSRSDPEKVLGSSVDITAYSFLRLPVTQRGLLRVLVTLE